MTLRPRAELSNAVGRDFEKVALSYFEIVFPEIIRPQPLSYWDRRGIDLMTAADVRPIQVCVQCKSTSEPTFDNAGIHSILDDIDKFLSHGIDAEKYIIALNRFDDGAIGDAVASHISAVGGAADFEVWDRRRLVKEAEAVVLERVLTGIETFNSDWRDKLVGRFAPSGGWIRKVPVQTFRLMLDRDGGPALRELREFEEADIVSLLLDDKGPRISVLTGHFGSGKTSAALMVAQEPDRKVLYVPASALNLGEVRSGTTGLAKEIVQALGIGPAIGAPSREFRHLRGRALTSILRRDPSMVLIIDGLDENRALRGLEGLQRLRFQLKGMVCRVILSTRTAHLAIAGEDLSAAFVDDGKIGRRRRGVRIVELRHWTDETVRKHIRSVALGLAGDEAKRLDELVELSRAGAAEPLYGALLSHPIFLDLIIDDVAAEGVRRAGKADLARSWLLRKVRRDQRKYTGTPLGGDLATESRIIFTGLEAVALRMSDPVTRTPTESLGYDELCALLVKRGLRNEDVLEFLLKSVLITLGLRSATTDARVMFSHRVFHEFLIASALRRRGESPPTGAPPEIAEFWAEIAGAVQPDPSALGLPPTALV